MSKGRRKESAFGSVCHPRLDRGSRVFTFFLRGFDPARRGSFDSAQDRLFCFGKRTQNHWRPGVAPRGAFVFLVILDICNRGSSVFVFFHVRKSKTLDSRSGSGMTARGCGVSGPGRGHARRCRELAFAFPFERIKGLFQRTKKLAFCSERPHNFVAFKNTADFFMVWTVELTIDRVSINAS